MNWTPLIVKMKNIHSVKNKKLIQKLFLKKINLQIKQKFQINKSTIYIFLHKMIFKRVMANLNLKKGPKKDIKNNYLNNHYNNQILIQSKKARKTIFKPITLLLNKSSKIVMILTIKKTMVMMIKNINKSPKI